MGPLTESDIKGGNGHLKERRVDDQPSAKLQAEVGKTLQRLPVKAQTEADPDLAHQSSIAAVEAPKVGQSELGRPVESPAVEQPKVTAILDDQLVEDLQEERVDADVQREVDVSGKDGQQSGRPQGDGTGDEAVLQHRSTDHRVPGKVGGHFLSAGQR